MEEAELFQHSSVLEINLKNAAHNLSHYRDKLEPGVQCMAMVKANAYGFGLLEMARFYQNQKVDYLGVAYTQEGVFLRENGITTPILVLNPSFTDGPRLVAHQLEAVLHSIPQIEAYLRGENRGALKGHLELETGMNRLGLKADELSAALPLVQNQTKIELVGVMSHFAAAGTPKEAPFTHRQQQLFESLSTRLEQGLGHSLVRHLSNSAGLSHFPQSQYNLVRLGIGLYGVSSRPQDQAQLKPAAHWYAWLSEIKDLQAGDTVSYGRTFKASAPMRIGVVSAGYGDGYRRRLSNGRGQVFIRGKRHKTLGRVCMDMFMVDLSGSEAQPGDRVELLGKRVPVQEVAQALDTISYEVFTGISQRVKRVYFEV